MRNMLPLTLPLVLLVSCGSEDSSPSTGGVAGVAGVAGTGATAATSGSNGVAGTTAGGTAGAAATGGSAGNAGSTGSTGSAGSAGAGNSGNSGSAGSAGSAGAAGGSGAAGAPAGAPYVFVGSGQGSIHVFRLDLGSGALQNAGTFEAGANPSFLAFHPSHPFLYAVDETEVGRVRAFAIDATTGALTSLGDVSSEGSGPAHLSVDRSGSYVLVSNYGSGTVAVLPILANGGVGGAVDTKSHGNDALSHQIVTDRSNQYVYVSNKGLSNISQYRLDSATGSLTPLDPSALTLAPGAGTRHLDFHPTKSLAYVVNELDDTVVTCSLDPSTGQLAVLQTLSTLEGGTSSDSNACAEIQVHPNGKFVYVSNRFGQTGSDDNIAMFAIQGDGTLASLGHHPTGSTPRHFQIDPTGKILVVGNQGDGSVSTMFVDPETGALSDTGESVLVPQPSFAGIHTLPAPDRAGASPDTR